MRRGLFVSSTVRRLANNGERLRENSLTNRQLVHVRATGYVSSVLTTTIPFNSVWRLLTGNGVVVHSLDDIAHEVKDFELDLRAGWDRERERCLAS